MEQLSSDYRRSVIEATISSLQTEYILNHNPTQERAESIIEVLTQNIERILTEAQPSVTRLRKSSPRTHPSYHV